MTTYSGAKSCSMSMPIFFLGRSFTCPTEAFTTYPAPRYFLMVLALAGDSTITSVPPEPRTFFFFWDRVRRLPSSCSSPGQVVFQFRGRRRGSRLFAALGGRLNRRLSFCFHRRFLGGSRMRLLAGLARRPCLHAWPWPACLAGLGRASLQSAVLACGALALATVPGRCALLDACGAESFFLVAIFLVATWRLEFPLNRASNFAPAARTTTPPSSASLSTASVSAKRQTQPSRQGRGRERPRFSQGAQQRHELLWHPGSVHAPAPRLSPVLGRRCGRHP